MTDTTYATSRKDGLMWAECWCQATTVLVTPADVRNGRTGTCGDDVCDPDWRPPAPPPPPRPRTLWAVLDCAQPNLVRRAARQFGSAIGCGDNVNAPATGEVPGQRPAPPWKAPT